jgi:hypothetical protein
VKGQPLSMLFQSVNIKYNNFNKNIPLGKISAGFLARLLNLISWSIFVLILVSGGGK